ncbi:MAG: protein kinase [Methylotenera sp.]
MSNSALNNLTRLRAGQLAGTKRLDLSCGLTEFPTEIYDLADSLEVLNLSGNALSSLPDNLTRLTKLKVLFCSENQFTHVPEVLGQCPELSMVGFKSNKIKILPAKSLPKKLQWLILTDNQLVSLPATLGQCEYLQKLMLAGNQLTHLPSEMAACEQLELLRISANNFAVLPEWLLSLPRLAWLAYAGNPFCRALENNTLATQQNSKPIKEINWQTLKIQQQLGEGASGVIYQADWKDAANDIKPVAVKLFKGAVTSDGLPLNEMSACISAGTHPNLSTIEGVVSLHPENKNGLVMSLIAPNFKNLANPPSLASCTRDIYAKETTFSINKARNIALGIANAAQHLHTKGIVHGDLYAHNILHNELGDCLLSDFGAASFLPIENKSTAEALKRIEVRAFSCLLEELIAHCNVSDSPKLDSLRALQRDCAQTTVTNRPLFAEIIQRLEAI